MEDKKIKWYMLSFMCFSTLWGFGNVVNGFMYFNGIQVIFSWILMFGLYFVPYALMVGELGSAFKDLGGGVTSWVQETAGTKVGYYAGFTYFIVHITYIASKGTGGLKALSWLVFRNAETYASFPTIAVQLVTLLCLFFFCWVAAQGLNPLKKLATLAGSSMFVMSILYIVLMFAAPAINPNGGFVSMDWSMKNLIPQFKVEYFTSLSILVFAVGGCEKISPYVNKVEDPSKGFPKGMIAVAIMVVVCAMLGTVAMGMMFDPISQADAEFSSYVSNGAYWAFQKLGVYYGVGDLFMVIYAACNAIGQFSTLVVSIDAPLRMLLDDPNTSKYVPLQLLKQNKQGSYVNGIKMVAILAGFIICVQMVVPGADAVIAQLNKLNSVCMPLRYLWVFFAYMMLRKATSKFPRDYMFVKNNTVALLFGGWCFLVTAACCILGMWSTDTFTLVLNVVTPIVYVCLGLIFPKIRAAQDAKAGN
ncbi:MAG: amino acid permease [Firmicutes bacterium]|nr:amino acid permease [Bacillota bacterium]